MGKSKLYVDLDERNIDDNTQIIPEAIVLKYGLEAGMKTVMGYEIKETK